MSEYQFPKFLMFGDSITQRAFDQYPLPGISTQLEFALGPALVGTYTRKMDILQRGFSGYNSEWVKYLLPKILEYEHDSKKEHENIKIAYLFIGTNDGRLPDSKLHVPIERYEENLKEMIDLFLEKRIKLIIVAPGLHFAEKWYDFNPIDKEQKTGTDPKELLKYADVTVKVANEYKLPYINMSQIMTDSGIALDELLCDGIHYTGKGYKLFFDNLLETIKLNYPEYHPDNLRMRLPLWSEVVADKLGGIE
ncbi:hypothetical protein BVG19_g2037 [[Candida] boidinii]|nr:hypothetical protein BVG19_g2037 [[Candida] boidinii]OWB48794.1 hypothetical protein B5S27_g331 [[Candida] boidinii]